jgi:hypothetical protein
VCVDCYHYIGAHLRVRPPQVLERVCQQGALSPNHTTPSTSGLYRAPSFIDNTSPQNSDQRASNLMKSFPSTTFLYDEHSDMSPSVATPIMHTLAQRSNNYICTSTCIMFVSHSGRTGSLADTEGYSPLGFDRMRTGSMESIPEKRSPLAHTNRVEGTAPISIPMQKNNSNSAAVKTMHRQVSLITH